MKLVYTPDGGESKEWEFSAGALTIDEAIYAEDFLDLETGELFNKMLKGSVRVMRVYLWLLRKRDEPDLQLSDLGDIKMREVKIDFSDEDDDEDQESGKDETPSGEDSSQESPAA